MGRDLDFIRKDQRQAVQSAPITLPEPDKSIPEKTDVPRKNSQKGIIAIALISLIVFGLLGLLIVKGYIGAREVKVVSTSKDQSQDKTISSATTLDMKALGVHDRGFGENPTKQIVQTLTGGGLHPKYYPGTGQQYKQSYLYYHASQKTDAEKILSLVSTKKLIVKESPLPGISLYLGTE